MYALPVMMLSSKGLESGYGRTLMIRRAMFGLHPTYLKSSLVDT